MHILYLCDEYPPIPHGGIGTFIQTIARQVVQNGHMVSVVGLSDIENFYTEDDQGVSVYRFPQQTRSKADLLKLYYKVYRFILQINSSHPIDLIEGSELSFGMFPRLPGKKIIRIHGGHHFFSATAGIRKRFTTSTIEKISFSRADSFCAVSQFAAVTTQKLLKLGSRSIEIIPNPVDTSLFRPIQSISEENGLIVYTGGLREKKGVRQLLKAMPEVLEKFPTAKLLIFGEDTIDHQGNSFLNSISNDLSAEVKLRIEFRGRIPHEDVPKINALASVLVYPSHMESQGIVVIEGMASGKPVVSSMTGPGNELIIDGFSGKLCNPHDPHDIADKILFFLENPCERISFGKNARQRAIELFSLEVLIPKNLLFYESCLNK